MPDRQSLPRVACACLTTVLFLAACSDGNDNLPPGDIPGGKPQADNPLVEGPVSGGGGEDCCTLDISGFVVDLREQGYVPGTPFYAGVDFDLAELGYRETEYFISGTASSYVAAAELGADGVWPVQEAEVADFKSRIVVVRPIDDAAFNGTVVVEWFNVSGGLDAAPDWLQMHTELMREGYVYVGVSAQSVGVEGGGGAFDISLKSVDAERYGSLDHPGDSFSYDIFSQAAQAVRNPQGLDPLEGLAVERLIGMGESQSAFRLVTYVNAIHPTIDLFDGFIIHSRGDDGASLSQPPQAEVPVPSPAFMREDLPEPVITLQTETDIFRLNSVVSRQPDAANLRLWEVAGSAHSDAYTTSKAPTDKGDDSTVADVTLNSDARPPFISCDLPVNDGPGHWVAKATLAALDRWIRAGEPAPTAPLLALTGDSAAFAKDEYGNVLGGIRSPYVDAPVAVLSGEGQPSSSVFCGLFGTTELLDEATMLQLYPTQQAYIDAIDGASDAAVAAGFLRPADADLIKERARSSGLGG